MEIIEYLNNHTIVKIGKTLPGYVCCEVIVENPQKLISVLMENECYITEIRWWDRATIEYGSDIGYGGPKDPNCPYSHYFAETDIVKSFTSESTYEEYIDYLDQISVSYSHFSLFPAFDIKRREKGHGDGSLS